MYDITELSIVDRRQFTQGIDRSRQRGRSGDFIRIFANDRNRTRPLSEIDSIVLHQTSFSRNARGDRQDAYDFTIAHFVVLGNGYILQLRDLEARLNSADSGFGIDIEFVGRFPNHRYDCERFDPRHSSYELPTMAQVFWGRCLIRYLVNRPELNNQIHYILAHRQITRIHRENCPGPHIWYNIARWSTGDCGLTSERPGARAIPSTWLEHRFRVPPPCLPRNLIIDSPRGRIVIPRREVTSRSYRRQGPERSE